MTGPSMKRGRKYLATFATGFRFQFVAMRGQVETYYSLATSPVIALIYLSIMEYSGRSDLLSHAVIAPMLMTLWTAALSFAGEMISEDRESGRLESLVATPAPFSALVFGRLCTCMLLAVPSFLLSYLTAGFVFGYWMSVHHPAVFLTTLVLTAAATAATATTLSSVFVLAPGARIVQNTLSFPMYLAGGVVVPVAMFPTWLEAASRLVYLSWSSDLLRAATDPAPLERPGLGLAMIVLLGLAALLLGSLFIVRFLRNARECGSLTRE